jgi:hypothetical protein
MSPIEHVWDTHDRQCAPVLANNQQLRTAIEWDNIPQAAINSLINSMQRRCVAPDTEWFSDPTHQPFFF